MYEKILVPLDGSDLAEQVFPSAVQLARAFNSELVLI
ncbi:MAG: universal stress protein [Chloroflexi bacterium]|nr:universal stress protein [Chloroflexota bacterium]